MQIAILILNQLLQFLLMMLMGYGIVKAGILKSEDSRVLSSIAVYLVTPCVIISAFQIDFNAQTMNGLLLAFAAAIISQLAFLLLISTVGKRRQWSEVEKASIMYSNAANMIIPIVLSVLGEEWVLYTSAYIAVQIVTLWTHCRSMLCGDKGFHWKKILGNINMISIFVAVLLFLSGIRLPALITGTFSSLRALMAPLGMFVLGMLMAKFKLKQVFCNVRIYKIAFVRLLFCPLMMLCILKLSGAASLFPNADTILFISFLATCTSPAVNITQMAQLYGKDAEYASAINLVSITLCVVTIPLMAGLYWYVIG